MAVWRIDEQEEIEVYTDRKGQTRIRQGGRRDGSDPVVSLPKSRLNELIKILQEVRDET